MGAFWSSTDDSNEQGRKLRLYSVYGELAKTNHAQLFRVGCLGEFFSIEPHDIFEIPEKIVYEDYFTKNTSSADNLNNLESGEVLIENVSTTKTEVVTVKGFNLDSFKENLLSQNGLNTNIPEEYGHNIRKIISHDKHYYEVSIKNNDTEDEQSGRKETYPETWWNMYQEIVRRTVFYREDSLLEEDVAMEEDVDMEEDSLSMLDFRNNDEITLAEIMSDPELEGKYSIEDYQEDLDEDLSENEEDLEDQVGGEKLISDVSLLNTSKIDIHLLDKDSE